MRGATAIALSLMLVLAGCGGGRGLGCADDERYREAASAPPVRVPDDLSLPNESEAVRVPPPPRAARERPEGACLEAPPDFFEEQQGA